MQSSLTSARLYKDREALVVIINQTHPVF